MEAAAKLASARVVVALAVQRLAEVAPQISKHRAQHVVVLHESSRAFLGVVKFADIAGRSDASRRILADLISPVKPMVVRSTESADAIASAFEEHRLGEAVILDGDNLYAGLITAESVLEWLVGERRRVRAELQESLATKSRFLHAVSHELRTPLTPVLLISSAQALNQDLAEAVRRDFRTIKKHITREPKLISDLIAVAAKAPPAAAPDSMASESVNPKSPLLSFRDGRGRRSTL
jgi:signal transduction histidine kinase